ncbi:DUF6602 domain-containing protein [Vibrio cholerae]|uniref:DUF6602 domain-containing protein n=1 Tax=Vibrio cholerae TaxID=666 RepID=UPI0010FCEB97|nr:DUF6602 domain-containing protein [Vibrio cholerae]TLE24503.1 hypothetical protein D2926_11375 [Vibrio cholerae]TLE29282.1 hypothetical protein D2927_11985 [Vibrio cholerae]TLE34426.1 hypothetical protein D2928_11400 [Vibrio cholerae]TLE48868.1 hypothetical protein D2929_08335 [Vibrio cholerae]TLE55400.1 hypothetical protein D2930_11475 [Vibrio cholerae]
MESYNGYIKRLSSKVAARLNDIEAIYNFELGSEFEVAMCHLLTDLLPEKYGVCRGFVVSKDGDTAGDDLIIFDKMSFPLLRGSQVNHFAIKQQVPIEAVYAYIECKHSINDKSVLEKAVSQVREVKKLLLKRAPNLNSQFETDGPVYNGKARDWPRQFPEYKNQPFCAVFSKSYGGFTLPQIDIDEHNPDLMVLGTDTLLTQTVNLGPDGIKSALFYDKYYWSSLKEDEVKDHAYGVGIVTLLRAIGWMELLPIEWGAILNGAYWSNLSGKA